MLREESTHGGDKFLGDDHHGVIRIIERSLILRSPPLIIKAVVVFDDLANTLRISSGRVNIRIIHRFHLLIRRLKSAAAKSTFP